ncbi:hypothetical protein KVT40_002793 [Elsinoe batatas]|uniref:Peptidase M6-like domain-containing protein n=1 Tax=Elsinoe batatas TaxID=2601811 RepID=A0A8K0LAZ4_9PEZI|nr:hypothetical protein KVT40_002793 [Elsinoe batatas]
MLLTKVGLLAFAASIIQAVPVARQELDPFAILDEQRWVNPDNMTWADFKAPPGTDWSNPAVKGSIRNFNIALVAVDYPDMDFVVTKPALSDAFGNPQPIISDLKREDVVSYYHDLLNVPQSLNQEHTLHEYWMEDSAGRYGVDLTGFGPYRLPRKSFQYGVDDTRNGFNPGACPEAPCSVDLRTDALGAWRAEIGNATADTYELVFILSAGQDESSTWQEFGEMKFLTRDHVPPEFGPPGNSSLPDWADTRYVDWTSWASAAAIWPNAGRGSSTQAESSGAATFAHELSHLLGIGDNYNNPYGIPARRSYTGPWSMMSRGSFNGPGGPHTRWQVPALQGASMGSLHTVRDKTQLGLLDNSSVLTLSSSTLAASGILTAELTARAIDERAFNGLKGVRIMLPADLSPFCNVSTTPLCDGGGYNNYELEVIDRVGQDSFTPDSGVMISKTKTSDRTQPFQWTIDANPQDINVVDFYRPDGTASMLTIGDYRQLADALFHAGTRSGSQFEYVDEANGLHLYVISPSRDESGVLRYVVAAKSLAGSGPSTVGVEIAEGKARGPANGLGTTCDFALTNTGTYSAGNASRELVDYFGSDVYRLEATVDGEGWRVEVPNALATAKFGESTTVGVAVGAGAGVAREAVVTLTATSESDATKHAVAECKVMAGGYGKRDAKIVEATTESGPTDRASDFRPPVPKKREVIAEADDVTICP